MLNDLLVNYSHYCVDLFWKLMDEVVFFLNDIAPYQRYLHLDKHEVVIAWSPDDVLHVDEDLTIEEATKFWYDMDIKYHGIPYTNRIDISEDVIRDLLTQWVVLGGLNDKKESN